MPSRREILERGTPLAAALPGAQFAEGHARIVNAGPERVWEVLHALRWRDLRLTVPLMAVRTVPVMLRPAAGSGGRAGTRRLLDLDRRLVDPPSPAAPLFEDPPRVSASGMIGRPWALRPVAGPSVTSLDELRAFDGSGWLKYGMEWVLSPVAGGRTLVETVTLCEATDAAALRRFAAYWALIRGFSGLVRRDILAAVSRTAT